MMKITVTIIMPCEQKPFFVAGYNVKETEKIILTKSKEGTSTKIFNSTCHVHSVVFHS